MILRDFQGGSSELVRRGASGDIIMWQQQHRAVFIIITKRIDILDIPSNLPGWWSFIIQQLSFNACFDK